MGNWDNIHTVNAPVWWASQDFSYGNLRKTMEEVKAKLEASTNPLAGVTDLIAPYAVWYKLAPLIRKASVPRDPDSIHAAFTGIQLTLCEELEVYPIAWEMMKRGRRPMIAEVDGTFSIMPKDWDKCRDLNTAKKKSISWLTVLSCDSP